MSEADPGPKIPKKPVQDYMKYSGLAFQMGAVILIGTLIGKQIDKYVQTPQPYFTAAFAVLSAAAALYIALKDFIKPSK